MDSKSIFKSKTFWFNALSVIATVSTTYAGLMPPAWLPYVAAAGGVANIGLRLMTDTSAHVTKPK